MGIIESHVLMALLLGAVLVSARALRRRRRWPRAARACMWFAGATLAAEVAVQLLAWRRAASAVASAPAQEKATLLARAVSLGLNAAAIQLAVLLAVLCALGVLALIKGSPRGVRA